MRRQILKNLFSNYIGTFAAMTLGFFLVPFLIRKLGKDGFGLTVLAESLIGFMQIFIYSVRVAMARYATVSISQGKKDEFLEYLSTGYRILSQFMILTLAAGLIVSYFFPSIFNVPILFYQQTRWLFFFIMIAFVVSMPNIVYWAILYAQQRFDLINISNFGGVIMRALMVFALFSFLPARYVNLVTYGVVYLLMILAENYFVFLWARKIMPGLTLAKGVYHKGKAKEIISYGGYSSFGAISTVIYENGMNIIINIFMGPAANAVYAISMKVPSLIKRLFLEPTWSLTPTFVNLVATGDKSKLERFFIMYSKGIAMFLFPLSYLMIHFSKDFIHLWVGAEFEQAPLIMSILVAAVALSMFTYFCSIIIGAYGMIRIPTLVGLGLAIANLGLGMLLGLVFKWGIEGIAVAALLISIIGSMIFLPTYTCRIAGISLWKFWREALLKPFFLTAMLFGCAVVLKGHTLYLMISFILAVILWGYWVCSYRFLFNDEEKNNIKDAFRDFFVKASVVVA
ncbi:MAG: oligosaccharide flippase family protein [Candidatus Omnitrophica bacterium]|nr:oligosaccharide flippase family protein [Candidatus Omnitrophota bacterium]